MSSAYPWGSTVTFSFADSTGAPIDATTTIHVDRIGGHASNNVINGASMTLSSPTWSALAGTVDFSTSPTTAVNAGVNLVRESGYTFESTDTVLTGTASGSLLLSDPVSSFTLTFVQTGPFGGGIDGIEFILDVEAKAELTLTKVASVDPVIPGTPYTYTITVQNTSAIPANNVVIDDDVDPSLTVNNVAALNGGSTAGSSGNHIECSSTVSPRRRFRQRFLAVNLRLA